MQIQPGLNKGKKLMGCDYGIPGCAQSNSETEAKICSLRGLAGTKNTVWKRQGSATWLPHSVSAWTQEQ